MRRRNMFVAGMLLVGVPAIALAQNFPLIDSQTGAPIGAAVQKAPAEKDRAGNASSQNSRLNQEQTSAPQAVRRQKKPVQQDSAATAAERQSGVNEVQARSALQQQGYGSIGIVEAQPNSIWVWQADSMKNGRRVRLGIDHRGKVLELGGTAMPCVSRGLGPTVGVVGVGPRLSEASRCAGP